MSTQPTGLPTNYWLETADDDLTPRPALSGSARADIAIVGAGFSGLWTAYYLLKRRPGLTVILLEWEIAGNGGSGRNGGWLSGGFPVTAGELARRYGDGPARAMVEAIAGAVQEVIDVCAAEAIDARIAHGGALRIARGAGQAPAVRRAYETYKRLGLDNRFEVLDAKAVRDRVRVEGAVEALFTADCAAVHPGRLVRGLARRVESMGARIFEKSGVTSVEPGGNPHLQTENGEVTAETVVLAGEAFLTRLPGLRRTLLPVSSSIILTEPLSEDLWDRLGWRRRECLSSMRLTVDYLSRTADGRILFGSRGAPYRFGSRLAPHFRAHPATIESLTRQLRSWFPDLAPTGITHAWSAAVGMPRDWMPTASFDQETRIASARGYTGQGVATSNLAARVLTDLILETPSALTELPIANHSSRRWPLEPLRWLAVRSIQRGLERVDRRTEAGTPTSGKTVAERLSRH